MKQLALMVVTAGLLIAADAPDEDKAKADLKKFEGTWVLVKGEQEGKPIPEDVLKDAKLVIAGNVHTVKVGEDTFKGTHKVDPTKKPRQIDATDTEGRFKDKTILGIYKIKGYQFTVCFAPPDKDRPKEFTTKSGTGHILHVWKRAKE